MNNKVEQFYRFPFFSVWFQAIFTAPPNFTALLLVAAGYIESSAYGGKLLGTKKVRDTQRSCFTQLAMEQGRMEAELYSCIQHNVIICFRNLQRTVFRCACGWRPTIQFSNTYLTSTERDSFNAAIHSNIKICILNDFAIS